MKEAIKKTLLILCILSLGIIIAIRNKTPETFKENPDLQAVPIAPITYYLYDKPVAISFVADGEWYTINLGDNNEHR